jgi:hypothetical protein
MQIQDINTKSSWITAQEDDNHYLLRWVDSSQYSSIEGFIQRLQICKHKLISIPELIRYPNGEVYLKERRGKRSLQQFLSIKPTTKAKLYLIRQISHALENLHTFVGIPHGSLSHECVSITDEGAILLGGINYISGSLSTDTVQLHDLIHIILTQSSELRIASKVLGQAPFRVRDEVNKLLLQDDWAIVMADWKKAVRTPLPEIESDDLEEILDDQLDEKIQPVLDFIDASLYTTQFDHHEINTEEAKTLVDISESISSKIQSTSLQEFSAATKENTQEEFSYEEPESSDPNLSEILLDQSTITAQLDLIAISDDEFANTEKIEEENFLENNFEEESSEDPLFTHSEEDSSLSQIVSTEEPSAEAFSLEEGSANQYQSEEYYSGYTEDNQSNKIIALAILGTIIGTGALYKAIQLSQTETSPVENIETEAVNTSSSQAMVTEKNEQASSNQANINDQTNLQSISEDVPDNRVQRINAEEVQKNNQKETKSNKTKVVQSNKTKVVQSNKTKEVQSNKTKVVQSNKTKVVQSNKTKVVQSNKTKVVQSNKTKEVQSNKTKEVQSNKTKVVQSNKTKEVQSNKTKEVQSNKTKEVQSNKTKENPLPVMGDNNSIDSSQEQSQNVIKNVEREKQQEEQKPQEPKQKTIEDDSSQSKESTEQNIKEDNTLDSKDVDSQKDVPDNTVQPKKPQKNKTIQANDLDLLSILAIEGQVPNESIKAIQQIKRTNPIFTRANAILLTHAQQDNNKELIASSLDAIFTLDGNRNNPVYLLAKAHQQFNNKHYEHSLMYILKAENNWNSIPGHLKDSLSIQKEMLRAHLLYTDYLQKGDPSDKELATKQFQKVSQLATQFNQNEAALIANAKLRVLSE